MLVHLLFLPSLFPPSHGSSSWFVGISYFYPIWNTIWWIRRRVPIVAHRREDRQKFVIHTSRYTYSSPGPNAPRTQLKESSIGGNLRIPSTLIHTVKSFGIFHRVKICHLKRRHEIHPSQHPSPITITTHPNKTKKEQRRSRPSP